MTRPRGVPLRRWVPVTVAAIGDDPETAELARLLGALTRRLRRQWVPASALPVHLVHGDVRLSNVRRTPDGRTVYLDFGFAARRPRVQDLAYALAFMVLALRDDDARDFLRLGDFLLAHPDALLA